ncbi:predicted protein [Histoplasma mississippiense (nom. inval.)]|uniref:predicted protein n=1 Tax=Ajellomyces capsulatus (strain NAm1 / WU24) TaxID=2059318 RepID=UPI000157CBE6|nr:predicted protein [Histoplasma mississippiense (nom. inval.)]EDN10759.1 predicted protein [Histoplasma mississippiense (nom. inval.)]
MASPVPLNLFPLLHAIGNTPAVCLTQDIPGDEPASLLLLGCGDVRHILFTSYMNSSSGDIQGCWQSRNVLLLTLVVDNNEGVDVSILWDIYYHLFVDDKSLSVLESQVNKLYRLSTSLRHWHKTKYGRFLRFCDSKTLALVRDVWYSYIHVSDKAAYTTSFRNAIQTCLDVKAVASGSGIDLSGVRSAAPNGVQALKDIPSLHARYWKNGTTSSGSKAANVHPNPTLAPLENGSSLLHYATDPLLGFHLVTAYTPVEPESPFYREQTAHANAQNAVETARLQFNTWCQAFKSDHKSVTVRFFAGEALTFCHTMQHLEATKETSANLFRSFYQFDIFSLDGEDYALNGVAPLAFDVIDTSNLIDFLGGINLFIATSPLLRKKASSTLYAESLVKYVPDVDVLLEDLFAGHFPTLSILLGVFPIQYWTNASAVANSEEQLMLDLHKSPTGHGLNTRNMYNRTLWKYQSPIWLDSPEGSSCPLIKFEPDNLALVLFGIYLKMFMNEDVKLILANPNREMIQRNSCIRYHRGSFARFLSFIKSRVIADWDRTISTLITLIEKDKILVVGQNFLHELYSQLHILGVYSDPAFAKELKYDRTTNDFRAWKKLPELVSITVEIPRAKLSIFTKIPRVKLGKPYMNGFVQSKQMVWQSLFAVVQLGFGRIIASGERSNDSFAVTIVEDHSGWKGKSPLIISFVVPSAILLAEPDSTTVGMSLYHTPTTALAFANTLGVELIVFASDLGNESSVYVSKQRPNNAVIPRISKPSSFGEEPEKIPASSYHVTLTAIIDVEKKIIDGFTAHIAFLAEEAKGMLKAPECDRTSPNLGLLPVFDYRKTIFGDCDKFSSSGPKSEQEPHDSDCENPTRCGDHDSRVCFKDTLFSMYMSFARVQGQKTKVFGINCVHIGLQLLFFRSAVRIDMSNRTLALDVAIIPLPLDMGKPMRDFITQIDKDESITMLIEPDELKLWKRILPAFVERCREWKHKATCEYKAKARIPLSVDFRQPVLCTCGNGIFPPNFIPDCPKWETFSQNAVRGLIPLLFTLPYVDPKDSLDEETKARLNRCEACGAEKSVNGRALLSCSQCHLVRYCSPKCQRTHWKVHRKSCLGKSGGNPIRK